MKLIIIGSRFSKESHLLKAEAIKQGHEAEIIPAKLFVFNAFDAILFRAINKHIDLAKKIAQKAKKQNKIIIDEAVAEKDFDFNKLKMHKKLAKEKIPQPETQSLKTPILLKPIAGMRGKGIFYFDNKNYFIQEFMPEKYYYRVFVIGSKVIGAIKRLALKCNNRPNLPLVKRSKKAALTPALKELALKAVKACDFEIAGVDIMANKVLEVNRSPRFTRFMQVTGINIAQEIIRYLDEKHKRLNRRNKC